MKLFIFNEDSKLNSSTARTINAICLGAFIILSLSNNGILEFNSWLLIFISLIASAICAYITSKVYLNTEFFEWDYTERQKKRRFIIEYIFICNILSTMFVFSIIIAYYGIISEKVPIGGIILLTLPILLLAFNLCNIISLFYPLFEKDLKIAYKIQKKPQNWQEKGREIKDEDEVKEIMRRDFDIDLD